MLSRNQLKLINSLRLQKFRHEEGLFVAEGVKLVDELLRSSFPVTRIFATIEWIRAGHIPQDRYLVEINEISQAELEKISSLTTPNQVLALAKLPVIAPLPDISGEWVLLLDQLRDPGNLGTIIRTADWFGFNRIIAAHGSVDVWNPKVVQASMGSVFRVPVHYSDIAAYLKTISGKIPVYGTLLEGESLMDTRFGKNGVVVIGNESHGISEQIKPYITTKITIPASFSGPSGRAESLNASIAAAIICYEIRKQCPD
ncbi:MAG: rRNA methylase [Bacteroidetes bacterium]|nr:MAG: rRNA methylase [Bacteroidota bacterium]